MQPPHRPPDQLEHFMAVVPRRDDQLQRFFQVFKLDQPFQVLPTPKQLLVLPPQNALSPPVGVGDRDGRPFK